MREFVDTFDDAIIIWQNGGEEQLFLLPYLSPETDFSVSPFLYFLGRIFQRFLHL